MKKALFLSLLLALVLALGVSCKKEKCGPVRPVIAPDRDTIPSVIHVTATPPDRKF